MSTPTTTTTNTPNGATNSAVYDTLTAILGQVAGISPAEIRPDTDIEQDLGIDSLTMLEVAVQAEDTLGVRVDDGDLAALHTVNDAAEYLATRPAA